MLLAMQMLTCPGNCTTVEPSPPSHYMRTPAYTKALYMGIVFSYAPESEGTELWWLGAGLIAVLQGLATISSQWSVGLKCAIGCKEVCLSGFHSSIHSLQSFLFYYFLYSVLHQHTVRLFYPPSRALRFYIVRHLSPPRRCCRSSTWCGVGRIPFAVYTYPSQRQRLSIL